MKHYYLLFITLFTLSTCSPQNDKTGKAHKQPNVVFFLVDDLGWKDISFNGSDFYQTPNVDQLAKKGAFFSNAYAACTVCSPTRASIMSGKYPARINCTDWITGWKFKKAKLQVPDWTMYMDTSTYTLAHAFKDAGYKTAHIGKWHLGEEEEYWPENQGFDINIAGWKKGSPNRNKKKGYKGYFSPYGNPRIDDGAEGEYLTERLTKEACQFIDANKEKPFFLNFWFYNVHTPLQAKEEKVNKYTELLDSTKYHQNPTYAAMVEHMDDAIGQVIQKLEEEGLLENTIIVFTSDNGGLLKNGKVTNNHPLRQGKGHIYEGGVRVPTIIVAPGVTQPSSTIDEPMISTDFYPTLLDLTNIKPTDNQLIDMDGKSLFGLLKGESSLDREALFWHYPHYHLEGATPHSVVRKGNFKLIHKIEEDIYELYNLKEDISESQDLSQKLPEKVEELKATLEQWKKEVGAQMPTPNPDYDPEHWNEIKW